jgi:hypothetical protein
LVALLLVVVQYQAMLDYLVQISNARNEDVAKDVSSNARKAVEKVCVALRRRCCGCAHAQSHVLRGCCPV